MWLYLRRFIWYFFHMIDVPWKWPGFKPLTPTRALEYLQKKPNYLAVWKTIIPNYFDAKTFCDIVNKIRIKRIEVSEKNKNDIASLETKKNNDKLTPQENIRLKTLKEQKKTIFPDTLKEIFNTDILPRIKNTDISYREVNQLIGSLLNISKLPKEQIQDVTEWVNDELHEDLSRLEDYESDILVIMDDLIHQFFTNKGIGNSINDGEKKDFGQQALRIFLSSHKEDIATWKIDITKLNTYLHTKKVI